MNALAAPEVAEKMARLPALYDAERRARDAFDKAPKAERIQAALFLQQAQQAVREARSLLPKLRLVVSN